MLPPSSARPKPYEQLAADNQGWFLPLTPPPAETPRGKQRDVIIVSCTTLRPEHPIWLFSCAITGVLMSLTRALG